MIRIKGEYEIWKDGVLIDRFHNIICVPVYENLLKGLNGETQPSIDVSYFAFGTGTTAVTEDDTTLETEGFRKEFTSKSWTGKQFVAICQLATDEANFTITEVGVFAGGSVTANTGTLLSHSLRTIEKNSNITYNIVYRLNLEEV